MAHFVYVRAGAVWANLSVLLASEMALFDQQVYKALNADDGGTWAPVVAITIGGAGLVASGEFFATAVKELQVVSGGFYDGLSGSSFTMENGSSTFWKGATTYFSTAAQTYNSGNNSTWSSGAVATHNAGSLLHLNGTVDGSGAFSFGAGATFIWAGICEFDSTVTVNGGLFSLAGGATATFGSSTTVTQNGKYVVSGSSAITGWRTGQTADLAGQTYGAEKNVWSVPDLGASRNYTVRSTTSPVPVEGTIIEFVQITQTAAATWSLLREDATFIVSVGNGTGAASVRIIWAQYPGDVLPRWHWLSGGPSTPGSTRIISNVS